MELTLISSIGIGSAVVYLIAALILQGRKDQVVGRLKQWLLLVLLVAALASLSFLIDRGEEIAENITADGLSVLLISLSIGLASSLTPVYLQQKRERLWLVFSIIWWLALVALTVIDEKTMLGAENWFSDTTAENYVPGLVAMGGWAAFSLIGLLQSFYVLYSARLPEVAYRATFWVMMLPVALMGAVLVASGSTGLVEVGLLIHTFGIVGMVYAAISLQVIDFRRNIRMAFSVGIYTLLTAVVVLLTLFVADNTELKSEEDATRAIFFLGLAIVAALVYTVLRILVSFILNRFTVRGQQNVASQLHSFAEAITGEVELDKLMPIIIDNQREILRVQRGGLILITEFEDKDSKKTFYKLKPSEGSDMPTVEVNLAEDSPIAKRLLVERKPLLQYEIDFDPAFKSVSPEESNFFKNSGMAAYAPVLPYGTKLGILGAGRKTNDETFSAQELELLSTIANQAGVALRNARLVSDLRHREQEASDTNKELNTTKEQLEQLDAVKTDFITIASHELRTPLAQIRGYTDIIEALNEQGMLDPEQLGSMTNNLRKATDRMEDLIRNMLDVSQLDVNAMDLRLSTSTVEQIVRMSIEPLTESIRNRKQSLTARGLRGLPEIEVDAQRIVQALQNIVLNAVKFTPDGGRIDISGALQTNEKTGLDEVVISIADSGIGIDKKNHEIIFEKFVRAHDPNLHSTGKTKFMGAGPGLGLTIARGVIEGHGGKIHVDSDGFDADKFPGSTFYVTLPVKPPEDATRTMTFDTGDREKLLQAVEDTKTVT